MLEPLRDDVILGTICDMQDDCLMLQIEFGSGWFSVISYLYGYHLEVMFTFYKTREKIIFKHVYKKIVGFIFEFKRSKKKRMVVVRTFSNFRKKLERKFYWNDSEQIFV